MSQSPSEAKAEIKKLRAALRESAAENKKLRSQLKKATAGAAKLRTHAMDIENTLRDEAQPAEKRIAKTLAHRTKALDRLEAIEHALLGTTPAAA